MVLLPLVAGVMWVRARMERLRYEEEMADLEFQQSLISELPVGGDADSRFVVPATDANDLMAKGVTEGSGQPDTALPMPVMLHPGADGVSSADGLAAGVMRQLTATGLLSGVDGYVALHGNPKGAALLKFRNGKQALLVPHMESEAFLRHNARRVDFIIMTGSDGRAVIVTPLEQFLAESVSGMV